MHEMSILDIMNVTNASNPQDSLEQPRCAFDAGANQVRIDQIINQVLIHYAKDKYVLS